MTAIAEAFVSIRPDFKGFKGELTRGISKEVDDAAAKAGKSGGRNLAASMASSATSSLRGVGDRITAGLGSAFKVGAATVAAGVATTIGLGLKRLVGIEEAQAKMRGLGYDTATVEAVMTNALASVKGTAFGLADAATVAAGVLAAGVKPGQDLERTLKLVGDASTIAGSSFGEMGSIFNKVGAANRLTMQEVNQLGDRGVPIMQWLADSYGVTALEARKMVEQGEVDFARFRDVIESNIGGAALESGNTTTGAFRNMLAAASRLGAVLAGPIFSMAQKFFTNMIGWVDEITPKAEELAAEIGPKLGEAMRDLGDWARANLLPVMERLVGVVRNGIQWYRNNTEAIHQVMRAAGPAALGVAALATSISLVTKAWMLLRAATPLGLLFAVGTAIVYLYQNSETFRAVVTAAFEAVQRVVAVAMPAISNAIDAVVPVLQNLLAVVRWVWGFMSATIQNYVKIIQGIISTWLAIFRGDWGRAWDGIRQILSAAWDQIRMTLSVAWEGIKVLTAAAISVIVRYFQDLPGRIVSAVQSGFTRLQDLGAWVVRSIFDAITAAVRVAGGLSDWFKGLPGRLWDWVMAGAQKLVDLGKEIVEKIKQGVGSAAKGLGDAILGAIPGGSAISSAIGNIRLPIGDGPGRSTGGSALNRVRSVLSPGTYVTSTYRSPAHNARVGGSRTSYHMDAANPAVDIGGSMAALDRLYARLRAMGGWRELIWRAPGHYDHIHVAHEGGTVSSSWPTIPGLRSDERPAILQVGEEVIPRGGSGGLNFYGNVIVRNYDELNRELTWYSAIQAAGV